MITTTDRPSAGYARARRLLGDRAGAFAPIWVATGALFLVSAVFAGSSLSPISLLTMLPYAGILAVAGLGQTLVIQQRGIDMSVPAGISLAAAIVGNYTSASGLGIAVVVVLALLAGAGVGLLNALVIFKLNVTPLIATLAVNTVVLGYTLSYSHGRAGTAPTELHNFAIGTTFGVPRLFLTATVITAIIAWVVRRTMVGRRLVAVGSGAGASTVIGIRVRQYPCLLYTSPSPRDGLLSRMPSSA